MSAKPDRHDPYLDCYVVHEPTPEMVPGRSRRKWMDATSDRYAYRCLPLTMANSTGWEILCPFKLELEWDGGQGAEAITMSSPFRGANVPGLAVSHFRHGIVTFHTGYMFRTPPGWGTWVSGPPNQPKDGIAPLTGLVETDWLPFPFTMNWRFTRPGKVTFAKNEPFAFITLMEHGRLEAVEPTLKDLKADAQLSQDYHDWQHSRDDFIRRLEAREPDTVAAGWQRTYMRGEKASGEKGSDSHVTKRRLKPLHK